MKLSCSYQRSNPKRTMQNPTPIEGKKVNPREKRKRKHNYTDDWVLLAKKTTTLSKDHEKKKLRVG